LKVVLAIQPSVAVGVPLHNRRRAKSLLHLEGHVGAVAFSRTGDLATGDFSDAKVIKKFGDVPDDLSAL
jgi:hypothetical protein